MNERIKYRFSLIRPLLVPIVLYFGFLALAINWLGNHPDSPWRAGVALLPMLPGLWIAVGVVQALTKLDELERRQLMEAASVSFAGTLLLVLSLGLLDIAGVAQPNGAYIALFMVLLALAGKLWSQRRYR